MCNYGDETWPSDNVDEWEGNLTPNKSKQDITHLDDSTTTTTTEDTTTSTTTTSPKETTTSTTTTTTEDTITLTSTTTPEETTTFTTTTTPEETTTSNKFKQDNTHLDDFIEIIESCERDINISSIAKNIILFNSEQYLQYLNIQNSQMNIKGFEDYLRKPRDELTIRLAKEMKDINLIHIRCKGDGNCYFRCISFSLFGTEDHHLKIRNKVANFLQNNKTYFIVDDAYKNA